MKTFLKYTLATFIVTMSMFTTNADALLGFGCNAKLGESVKDNDLKKIMKCATEGHKNPKFVASLVKNPNCKNHKATWKKACAAATEHHAHHTQAAEAKTAGKKMAAHASNLAKLEAKVEKDEKVVEKAQEILAHDQEALKAAGGSVVNAAEEEGAAPAEDEGIGEEEEASDE